MKIRTKITQCFALLIAILFLPSGSDAHYRYERQQYNNHVIHVVILNQNDYELRLVKAKNKVIGRETVKKLAEQYGADVALNGGFFLLDPGKEGKPAGTLIIDGKVFNFRRTERAHLIKANNQLFIQKLPDQLNVRNGNIIVPTPADQLAITDNASVIQPTASVTSQKFSAVMGIPQLVIDGKINPKLLHTKGNFYLNPHARTAIGLRPNQDIVIAVAEHDYATGSSTGLTVIELARLMLRLGCKSALNLDGGGSSTLWIAGSVVNHPIGDMDEDIGAPVLRPVSDAIILKKKSVVSETRDNLTPSGLN